jgi:general secretion pathway protein N
MNRWSLVALGVAAYAGALVAMAPATLIDWALARESASRVRLTTAEGTVWSGSGFVEIRDAKQRARAAKRVAWRVAPTALLRGALAIEATTSDSRTPISITATFSRVEIANAELSLPAGVLGLAAPKLEPLELTGNLSLQIARLTLADGDVHGNARAQWRAAGSSLTKLSPLGSYELEFMPEGAGLRATLRTLDGPLALEGAGSWTKQKGPAFRATAEVASSHREALAPVLRLVAIERGPGRFDLEL